MSRDLRSWVRVQVTDIVWGVRYGVKFAAVYCLIALLIFALEGQRPFLASDTTLGRTLVLYVAGGAASPQRLP